MESVGGFATSMLFSVDVFTASVLVKVEVPKEDILQPCPKVVSERDG